MLRQESFSHTVPLCTQSVCSGKLPLPLVCIISNHLHVFSPNRPSDCTVPKLSPCRPPICQAPASLYNLVLIRHLLVVNPSLCLPKLSFLDLAFQPLGFSPSAGGWISAPFPSLKSHWSLLLPANSPQLTCPSQYAPHDSLGPAKSSYPDSPFSSKCPLPLLVFSANIPSGTPLLPDK